jgi:non-heme chloroperoxidase
VLVAWSFATAVVGRYLAVHGDAALAGINFVGGVPGPEIPGSAWADLAKRFRALEGSDDKSAVVELINQMTEARLTEGERDELLEEALQTPREVRRALQRMPPTPAASTAKPVLFSHGAEDRITRVESVERGLRVFVRSRASIYAGVGHMPHWEMPERFNAELRDFARSLHTMGAR